MNEGQVHAWLSFPAHDEAAEVVHPGECALHLPAPPVAAQTASVLSRRALPAHAMRHDQLDLAASQPLAQRVAVVRLVGNQSLGLRAWPPGPAARDADRLQRSFDECDLSRRGGVNGCCERNTLAVDHHHALRAFASLCLADSVAPFFAEAKVASAKASSQFSQP